MENDEIQAADVAAPAPQGIAGHFSFALVEGIPTFQVHANAGKVDLPKGSPVRRIRLKEGSLKVGVETALGEFDLAVDATAQAG